MPGGAWPCRLNECFRHPELFLAACSYETLTSQRRGPATDAGLRSGLLGQYKLCCKSSYMTLLGIEQYSVTHHCEPCHLAPSSAGSNAVSSTISHQTTLQALHPRRLKEITSHQNYWQLGRISTSLRGIGGSNRYISDALPRMLRKFRHCSY